MRPHESVGIEAYRVATSCSEFLALINKKHFNNPNPIADRQLQTKLPLNKLEVGQSIWIDMDICPRDAWNTARLSCVRYGKIHDGAFLWKKHRGDARTSGFKYLEIARIK